ncbi:MAG TPA: TadE family protein [Myxococcales bacterium]|nr:TadE family protein [Myxococcales bacterium]
MKREEGQAVVEAAIVLPAMIFLILMTIQVAMLQQARIMAEYAAFSAARTGIVANGDNGKGDGQDGAMHDAAVLAILPTFGNTSTFPDLNSTLLRFRTQDTLLKPFGLGQVRVFVHNPMAHDFRNFGSHLNGQELDFDDVRPLASEAALLSVQVRYMYEMRVPFANKLLQTIWMATHANVLGLWGGWDMTSPRFGLVANGPDAVAISRAVATSVTVPDGTPEGVKLFGLVAASESNRFFFPVYAWYTMRMQSNPYLRWANPN